MADPMGSVPLSVQFLDPWFVYMNRSFKLFLSGPKIVARTVAPDFTLRSTPDQNVSLKQFLGRPVILAFYPADWSPVCGDEMSLFNHVLKEFQKFDAQLIGISVDGIWSHLAFSKDRKLQFTLLSDFEPKGAVSKSYGVYRETDGESERALFVIDGKGIIKWSYLSPVGINPGANGVLDALESLDSKRDSN